MKVLRQAKLKLLVFIEGLNSYTSVEIRSLENAKTLIEWNILITVNFHYFVDACNICIEYYKIIFLCAKLIVSSQSWS